MELMGYLEANRKALEDAPNGLYAVVAAPAGHAVIQLGVIFCLEQRLNDDKKPAVAGQKVNPLQPYFLVYVRDDGAVRYIHPCQTGPGDVPFAGRRSCRTA